MSTSRLIPAMHAKKWQVLGLGELDTVLAESRNSVHLVERVRKQCNAQGGIGGLAQVEQYTVSVFFLESSMGNMKRIE